MKEINSGYSFDRTLGLFSVGLFGLTIIASGWLYTSSATATTTSATATVRINSACSLSSNVDTPHTTTLSNGSYSGASGYGQTTIKAFCNDAGGFSIYAIGYTGNEYANTTMHWNKATSSSDNTNAIPTEVYSAGNMSNSSWSMKLASSGGTYAATIVDGTNHEEDFTSWHTIPANYTKVAYRTASTDTYVDTNSIGSSVTLTYDTYIIATQPAGSYTGKVKFTLVHPNDASIALAPGRQIEPLDPSVCPANRICYSPNYSSVGSMSSLPQTSSATALTAASPQAGAISATANSTATLVAPNFKRDGYGFAGWSTSYDATTAANPVIYGPNEVISTNPNNGGVNISEHGLILYPVWIASTGNMQEWNGCSGLTATTYNTSTGKISATLSSVTALTDTRDGNVYAVAKLVDGNCWMIENLRLDAEHSRGAENIAKAQGYATSEEYGNFIGLADSEDTGYNSSYLQSNSIYGSSNDENAIIKLGHTTGVFYSMPRYNGNNTNMTTKATNSAGTTLLDSSSYNNDHSRWYGYGNYYTWAAAMANTKFYRNHYDANNLEEYNSDVAGTSICPKGWELPLGDTSTGNINGGTNDSANRVGSFSYLDRKMGGTGNSGSTNNISGTSNSYQWQSFPNNYTLAGYFGDNSRYDAGANSCYWTRSASNIFSGSAAHSLRLESTFDPSGGLTKTTGTPVRCILISNN